MGLPIDQKSTATADSFTAIVLKSHRSLAGGDELFVELIESFEKREVGREALQDVALELPGLIS